MKIQFDLSCGKMVLLDIANGAQEDLTLIGSHSQNFTRMYPLTNNYTFKICLRENLHIYDGRGYAAEYSLM